MSTLKSSQCLFFHCEVASSLHCRPQHRRVPQLMAYFISWSSLLFLWAGGPLLSIGGFLLLYCYCVGGKAKRGRGRNLLPN